MQDETKKDETKVFYCNLQDITVPTTIYEKLQKMISSGAAKTKSDAITFCVAAYSPEESEALKRFSSLYEEAAIERDKYKKIAYSYAKKNIKCTCKDEVKHGETSVMCCNRCGLPTEEFWEVPPRSISDEQKEIIDNRCAYNEGVLSFLLEKIKQLKPKNNSQEVALSVIESMITETAYFGNGKTLLQIEKEKLSPIPTTKLEWWQKLGIKFDGKWYTHPKTNTYNNLDQVIEELNKYTPPNLKLLKEVLDYFDKDTTDVPQDLYKTVFQTIYPPTSAALSAQLSEDGNNDVKNLSKK